MLAAHAVTLVVLPSGLWRIALALGFSAGYTAEGFVGSLARSRPRLPAADRC